MRGEKRLPPTLHQFKRALGRFWDHISSLEPLPENFVPKRLNQTVSASRWLFVQNRGVIWPFFTGKRTGKLILVVHVEYV